MRGDATNITFFLNPLVFFKGLIKSDKVFLNLKKEQIYQLNLVLQIDRSLLLESNQKHFSMKKLFFAALVATLSLGCNDTTKSAFDLVNAKKEIELANQNLVELLAKNDSVGFANSYTEDAKFMGYNEPSTEGRSAIQTIWAKNMNAGATNIQLTTLEVWGNETSITEEGLFDFKSKEGIALDKGKYIVVWVNENGKWKIHRDIFNSNLPVTK